jgi:hypothetical protein
VLVAAVPAATGPAATVSVARVETLAGEGCHIVSWYPPQRHVAAPADTWQRP